MPAPRLRAPVEHGGILAEPALERVGELVQSNQSHFRDSSLQVLGQPLSQLRALARAEVRAMARDYLHEVGILAVAVPGAGFIVTGHQPELFHPGVWIKNFAAAGLARRHGLTALHLIVDNDVVKATSIRVPDLRSNPVHAVRVPFDAGHETVPFEEYEVVDEEVFARFPDAVAERLQGANFQPLLPQLWEYARQLTPKKPRLGERLAGARRLFEESWSCHNLELPLSRLCRTDAFAWFAWHLLEDLPRFHAIHNRCLLDYRKRRHIRSRNHPVPELHAAGDWLEAPFWVWRRGVGERQHLFARWNDKGLELQLGENVTALIPRGGGPERAIQGLRELETAGFKIRTRALTTTLFARLFLADLFIHGIGGAIYDELTDAIIAEFYGIPPPRFLTLSATLRLPLELPPQASLDLPAARREVRDLWWNPDRHLNSDIRSRLDVLALCNRKADLVGQAPATAEGRWKRFESLREVNDALRAWTEGQTSESEARAAKIAGALGVRAVLRDREYAFCLHPEESLRSLFSTAR